MSEIEKRALTLVNECGGCHSFFDDRWGSVGRALCRALEQKAALQAEFDQYKRDVSDVVEDYCGYVPSDCPSHPITRFIVPKPKPDPLVEAMDEWWDADGYANIETFRKVLAARGLKIVEAE